MNGNRNGDLVGRHAGAATTGGMAMATVGGRRAPRRHRARGGLVLVVVLLLVGAFVTPAVLPGVLPGVRGALPWFPAGSRCERRVVEVVTAPLAEPIVSAVAAELQNRVLPDDGCLQVQVRAQAPDATVSSTAVLPPARAPQIWVSDSSLWTTQVTGWKLQRVGALGSSPVVLATSAASVQALGWSAAPPSWRTALGGSHPVAAPDLSTNADATLAMMALWQAAGQGGAGDRAVAAAVLVAGRTHVQDGESAVQVALRDDPAAPLITTNELSLITQNRNSTTPNLTAVYPAEGSPVLDFPVLRVSPESQTPARTQATTAVLAALTGAVGRTAARAAGLRDPDGSHGSATDKGVAHGGVTLMPAASAASLSTFSTRLGRLAAPSRILAVIDVSLSMETQVAGTGLSRIQLAGRAASAAGELLTDASAVGLWTFAQRLDGDKPYKEIAAVAPLGAADGATTHRVVVNTELAALDGRLAGGGTGLYETALAAVRAMRVSYDPRAANTVVLFTDGTNENAPGMTLDQLVQAMTLDVEASPERPVRLVGIGMGPTADMKALQAMVAPTRGAAIRADTPSELRQALYQLIAARS